MRRARIHAYGYKRQLFALELRFLPWILLSRLPAIYQDLVYLLPAYARAYGLNWTLSLPAIPLSPLGQTAVFDLFHLAVALLYLPAFTVAQASYYDTAKETNPSPSSPGCRRSKAPKNAKQRPGSQRFRGALSAQSQSKVRTFQPCPAFTRQT